MTKSRQFNDVAFYCTSFYHFCNVGHNYVSCTYYFALRVYVAPVFVDSFIIQSRGVTVREFTSYIIHV